MVTLSRWPSPPFPAMPMAMVNIGKVRMLVHDSGMRMLMDMIGAGHNLDRMLVPMVLVMAVAVGMA